MRTVALALTCGALAAALTGCVSESADLGRPTPVVLETPQRPVDLVAQVHGRLATRAAVRRALVEIGDGSVQSVRVVILARSPTTAERLRRLLIGLGVDPVRLTEKSWHGPGDRLVLTHTVAETVPCAAAIHPVAPDDPLPSLMNLARCTQDNNLAEMLVDPGDLVDPPRLAAQDGDSAAGAIRSWRSNRDASLPTQDTTASAGYGGGTVAGAAPTISATAGAPGTLPGPTGAAVNTTAPAPASQ